MLSTNYAWNSKLLCTFCYPDQLDNTVAMINNHYSVIDSKIYLLELENDEQIVLTYNISKDNVSDQKMDNTFAIHRDRENNVLYTIDALEKLNESNPFSKSQVNWSNYKKSFLMTRGGVLNVVKTKLKKIITN